MKKWPHPPDVVFSDSFPRAWPRNGFQKETRCCHGVFCGGFCGRVVRLLLVLLLALEVPPSSIRRPSPFGPSFLFLFVKVKKIDLSGTRTSDDRSSKLGPLDYASQSSSEVGCVLKGAQLAVRSTNPRQYIHGGASWTVRWVHWSHLKPGSRAVVGERAVGPSGLPARLQSPPK